MKVYEVMGQLYSDPETARKEAVAITNKYIKKCPLDEISKEALPNGGYRYVADRELKGDSATTIVSLEIREIK